MILAAFRPDTKARLVEEGLVAPTVQFVFRRSQRSVLSREDYFSGLAHPSAFPSYEIGLARMVSLANAIAPDAIPPLVRLERARGGPPREGVDYFGEGLSEQLFDTPRRSAAIWRGKDYTPPDARLGRGDPRPERPAARDSTGACCAATPSGCASRPRDGAAGGDRDRLAGPAPGRRGEPGPLGPRRHRRLRRQRRARFRPGDRQPAPARATRPAATSPGPTAPAHRRDRPRRPGEGGDLPRPDADGARRLARRIRLRRHGPAHRLAAPPRRPRGGLRRRGPADPRARAAKAGSETAAVRYPLRRTPAGGLAILELRGDALDPEPSW